MRPETGTTHVERKPKYYDVPGRFCPGTCTAVTAGIPRQCARSLRATYGTTRQLVTYSAFSVELFVRRLLQIHGLYLHASSEEWRESLLLVSTLRNNVQSIPDIVQQPSSMMLVRAVWIPACGNEAAVHCDLADIC